MHITLELNKHTKASKSVFHLEIFATKASGHIVFICYCFESVQTFPFIPAGFLNIT